MKYIISICLLLLSMPKLHAQQLVGYEYFFNTDPGVGQGIYVAITPVANYEASINLNTTGLTEGLQSFGIRFKDSEDNWSTVQAQHFINLTQGNGKTDQIKAIAVFFDEDAGIGNGILVPITATDHLDQTINIPIPNTITSGSKVTYVRAQNTAGLWSQYQTGNTALTVSIKEYENLKAQGLSFYPNPANHYINISMDNALDGKIEMVVMDISGRIVLKEHFNKAGVEFQYRMDCSKLNSGNYTISFVHQNKTIGSAKIVVQK